METNVRKLCTELQYIYMEKETISENKRRLWKTDIGKLYTGKQPVSMENLYKITSEHYAHKHNLLT